MILPEQRVKGKAFSLAKLRGGSLLSGYRVESPVPGAGVKLPAQVEGKALAQLSDGNRHLILGIASRVTLKFLKLHEAGSRMLTMNGQGMMIHETDKTQRKIRQERDL